MHARIILNGVAIALSFLVCGVAAAQFEEASTNSAGADKQLVSGAQMYQRRSQTAWVTAYVAGVIDADDHPAHASSHDFCLPAHGNLPQYTEVFLGYLSANPKRRQEPASSLVRESLAAAFTCGDRPN